ALQADGWICRSVIVWRKPAPMPASLAGWRWQRCRVKVKAGNEPRWAGAQKNGVQVDIAHPPSGSDGRRAANLAQWADCPGCKKCAPNKQSCRECEGTGLNRLARAGMGALSDACQPGPCPDCAGRGWNGYVLR